MQIPIYYEREVVFPKAYSQSKGFYPSEVQYARPVAVTLRQNAVVFYAAHTQ